MELFAAIEAGDGDAVRTVLERDPGCVSARNDTGITPVLAAQYRHRRDLVDLILAAAPELDVFDAAAVGEVDRLAELLESDPQAVNAYAADGFYPLGLAAYFGHPDAVQLLLARGADVGQVARNPMQVQALHAAVAGRNEEAVRLLLQAGADPNAVQHGGWTPLMAAEEHGDERIIELLLAHGADPASGKRSTTS